MAIATTDLHLETLIFTHCFCTLHIDHSDLMARFVELKFLPTKEAQLNSGLNFSILKNKCIDLNLSFVVLAIGLLLTCKANLCLSLKSFAASNRFASRVDRSILLRTIIPRDGAATTRVYYGDTLFRVMYYVSFPPLHVALCM